MKRHGGVMTAEDLSEYSSEWVEPISTTYRDWTVFELPPNGQGLAALEMLNIMEKFPLGTKDWGFGSVNALHTMIEAKKLAYADLLELHRRSAPAETSGGHVAFERMGGEEIQADRCGARQLFGRRGRRLPAGSDTTYLSVVDREGNMVSLIQSNYEAFGSGIVAERHGIRVARSRRRSSRWIPHRRMHWRDASARCTPSFRRSRKRATRAWLLELWAAGTSRRPTPSSSPIFRTSR